MSLNDANHRAQPIPAWLVDPPRAFPNTQLPVVLGLSSGASRDILRQAQAKSADSSSPRPPIATHAINDGSTRVICVPSPGPFPALGRATMAQRDAGSGCVDGSSWSAAIGRRSTSLWARVSRPIREWHSPRPTPVRAARTAVGRPCRLNLTASPPTSRPELPMGSQGSRPVARPSAP
jgi:hypothetical protein